LIAASWIVYYLAFSVPVLIAGVAITHFGLHQTAVVYSAALAAAAAGSFLFRRRSLPAGRPSDGTSRAERPARKDEADDRADHGAGGRSPHREAERDVAVPGRCSSGTRSDLWKPCSP
jgi:hypothetical protein